MIPKADWGDGPWQHEPDASSFIDDATGYVCDCVRNMEQGHWCGYVGVPKGHAWYGVEAFDHVPVRVHGGVNWARGYSNFDDETRDAQWWFGFDCGHSFIDHLPGMVAFLKSLGNDAIGFEREGVYRDLNYVREQCVLLAVQLKALANVPPTWIIL